ncbi:sensor histidine kinase [Winogradskyella sp. Asnod2-B02-A]|uniref:sensor histidine kinase n=1 Tax=Winogradskyella sp. Asnod2-B02-A TaxID=3160583 RepID=UPI00386FFF6F
MQNLNFNTILKSNYHRPLRFNSVLWLFAFVILLFIFSKGQLPIRVDFAYTLTFLTALAIPVLINFYVLIPNYLKQEKYLIYSVIFIINLVVFATLSSWFLQPILDVLFPSYFFISYVSDKNIYLVFIIFLVATSSLKLTEDWFYFNKNQNQLLKIKNQHIETQLSTLRAQLNPHFLFNSLNVIYALALEKKDGITEAIVQLSDILRYVIYDSDTKHVSLKDEIALLKNYISFQNHRIELPVSTQLNIEIEDENFKVYPMLLLPLLENSYKHGIIAGKINSPIKMELSQKGHQFKFTIENTNLDTSNQLQDKHSGIGLENLKNNLNLVYPNKHQFETKLQNEVFKVLLTISNEK